MREYEAYQPPSRFVLKKLLLWGDERGNLDFEWPTKEIFERFQPDVKIKSLELKMEGLCNFLSSLKFNLSGEQASPAFELARSRLQNQLIIHQGKVIINFDHNLPIRSIKFFKD